jgi:hypothetical protein
MVASMPLRFSSVKKIRFVVNSFPLASTATSLFAVQVQSIRYGVPVVQVLFQSS